MWLCCGASRRASIVLQMADVLRILRGGLWSRGPGPSPFHGRLAGPALKADPLPNLLEHSGGLDLTNQSRSWFQPARLGRPLVWTGMSMAILDPPAGHKDQPAEAHPSRVSSTHGSL